MAENGFFGDRITQYHSERAKGGTALTITEELAVHSSTQYGLARNVRAFEKESIPGFKIFTKAIHDQGAKTFGQLWHGGLNVGRDDSNLTLLPKLAVSSITSVAQQDGWTMAKEMTVAEIHEIQEGYVSTARNLIDGGFDGIELHATHSYLPQQFLSPLFNKRTDRYGGTRENRTRFLLELIEMLSNVVEDKKVFGVALVGNDYFPGSLSIDEMKLVAASIDSTDMVHYLNITPGGSGAYSFLDVPPMYYKADNFTHLPASIRRVVKNVKIFAAGKITDPLLADQILIRGDADLVVMMRAQIADPELANKIREGRYQDIIPCVGCNQACLGHVLTWGIPISCILNPTIGREKQWGIGTLVKAPKTKRVLIVGAGPAGCEASIIAAKRGHDVTLVEKSSSIGGQAKLAAKLPGREDFQLAINYWQKQIEKLGVKLMLNREAKQNEIIESEYDAVLIATGSNPDKSGAIPLFSLEPSIPGIGGNPIVKTVDEILDPNNDAGRRVVIYDDQGDIKGVALAELLASRGSDVEIISRLNMLGEYLDVITRAAAQIRAFRRNVKFTPNSIVRSIEGQRLTIFNLYNNLESLREEVDTFVLVNWRHPENRLYQSIQHSYKGQLFVIGDSVSPRSIEEAVYEGHKVAREL